MTYNYKLYLMYVSFVFNDYLILVIIHITEKIMVREMIE